MATDLMNPDIGDEEEDPDQMDLLDRMRKFGVLKTALASGAGSLPYDRMPRPESLLSDSPNSLLDDAESASMQPPAEERPSLLGPGQVAGGSPANRAAEFPSSPLAEQADMAGGRVRQIQGQQQALENPPLKTKLLRALVQVAPIALAGAFGGAGSAGAAAEGVQQTQQQQDQDKQLQENRLLQELDTATKEQGSLATQAGLQQERQQRDKAYEGLENARTAALASSAPKTVPLANALELWHQQNPDAPVSDFMKLENDMKPAAKAPPTTSEEDKDRYIDIQSRQQQKKPVTPDEAAWAKSYEKASTLGPAFTAGANAPSKEDARLDKSFEFNSKQLETLRTPISQIAGRISNLKESLRQATPQSDALVAPEFLSVIAGGQGTGIRVNDAEINRVVGGRSHYEDLKAAWQKWSTDPSKANSITPAQRQQTQALVDVVSAKVDAKLNAIEQGESDLLDGQTPEDHRLALRGLRSKLDSIDSGAGKGRDLGLAPAGRKEGDTGKLKDGTSIIVRGGRLVSQ